MYYIPTYAECEEIIAKTPSNWFYRNELNIDGYKIVFYNYILAWYQEFVNPIPNSPIKATELRGITFVFNTDGSLYKRYIQLNKFWNINQVEETQLDVLSKNDILSMYEKLDGTMISFIKLPNGRIISKTKASFDHIFLKEVDRIVATDVNYQNLINDVLESGCVPFFEYMSLENKVVIDYTGKNLTLIGVRDLSTGRYLDIETYRDYGVDVANKIAVDGRSLAEVVEYVSNATGIEGLVIHFKNDYNVKIKSKWYFDLHRIVSDSIYREDIIIGMYLDNTLDDVVSRIPVDRTDKLGYIDGIKQVVDFYIEYVSSKTKEFVEENYDGDMKAFCIKHNRHQYFNYAKKLISYDTHTMVENIIAILKKNTYFYKNAQAFVLEWKEKMLSCK